MTSITRRDFLRTVALAGASAAVPWSGLLAAGAAPATSRRANFLVILADDLGYNDLGCYGARDKAIQTPNIDRMAAEGIRFTDWFSACSVCAPARAALLTGRYPSRCGLPVCPGGKAPEEFRVNIGLQQSEITIPELLKPLGYRTAMFGKSHLGDDPKFYPLRHGFDEYYGSLFNFPVGGTCPVFEGDTVVEPKVHYHEIHERLTRRTIRFMARSKEAARPFCIYLAPYLVHGPWEPNRRFATDEEWAVYQSQKVKGSLGGGGARVYPALVRELDWHIGEILKALKELGLDNDTLVLFTSDNGPWLPAGSAWPLRGSKYNTFEGGHRVASIARWPGKIPARQVCDKLCTTMDYFPTIAHLAGVDLPKDRVIDGINIWPLLSGHPDAPGHEVLFYYNGITLEAVRHGRWKLHLARRPENKVWWSRGPLGGFNTLDKPILYDLQQEIGEQKDMSAEHPDVLKRMLDLAEQARAELGDWNRAGRDRKKLLDFTGNPNRR